MGEDAPASSEAGTEGPGEPSGPIMKPPTPRTLCDTRALTAQPGERAGALWRLAEDGRQLDANLVHLPGHHCIETHTEPDLDVLLLVAAGDGTLHSPQGMEVALAEGVLCWLPHGSTRKITASAEGLSYLTVHRRRPGMQVKSLRSGALR
jgi:quercetin dioxygenase-like cupin family protein